MRALSLTNTLFLKGIMALAVFCICFWACKEDTPVIPKFAEAKLLTFKFEASKNTALTADVLGTVNETTKTVAITLPLGVASTSFKPTVTTSPKATIVDTTTAKDFSTVQTYIVTAGDEKTSVGYTVTVTKVQAVGFESGSIPNSSFSASETFESPGGRYQAYHARLNQPTAWEPRNPISGHWLQVDLLSSRKIVKLAIQGNGYEANEYVKTFKLYYGDDQNASTPYNNGEVLNANVDRTSVVTLELTPFTARYVKVVPVSWDTYPAIRMELYEEVKVTP